MRPALLALALLAAPASAQDADTLTGDRALAFADSLIRALRDEERARFAGVWSAALYGGGGTLYFDVNEAGHVRCSAEFGAGVASEFSDLLCLLIDDMDSFEAGFREGSVVDFRVWETPSAGYTVRVEVVESDGGRADDMEMHVATDPLRLVGVEIASRFAPGLTMDLRVERGDFREVAGVLLPHTFRLTLSNPAALLASVGAAPDEVLAQARREARDAQAPDAAFLALAEAAAAGAPYEGVFTVDRVEVERGDR